MVEAPAHLLLRRLMPTAGSAGYFFIVIIIIIRHETTAAASWALLLVISALFNNAITVAVWTGLHRSPPRSTPIPEIRKGLETNRSILVEVSRQISLQIS
jgi:hypothetical protein